MDLKFVTFNANGLNDKQKRKDVFTYLRDLKSDIFLLQETHLTESQENFIRAEWGNELWVAGRETNKNGVAVLFRPTFEYKIHKIIRDPRGCYIIVDLDLLKKRTTLINVYGPSGGDNPAFFENISSILEQIGNEHVIMGGDFNCVLEPCKDTRNYANPNSRPRTREKIKNMMAHFDLIDIFRSLFPDKKEFSWRRFRTSKQGRLDYFLVSHSLSSDVKNASINPGYRSDHSIVNLSLKKIEFKRDRTYWKFNNSLLTDKEYVSKIKGVIKEVKEQYAVPVYSLENIHDIPLDDIHFVISDQLFFEVLLMEIRGKTISHASYKKKKDMQEEEHLNKKLRELENNNCPLDKDIPEIEEIKLELEQFRRKKIEGINIRTRARWLQEGEKPTQYFCNIENRNYVNKSVGFLEKQNGEIIDDQKTILNEVKEFYENLYTEKVTQDVDLANMIPDAPKLEPDDIESMEGVITVEEIALVLKDMKNGKSPGPDGFTCEFYKFFFRDIGKFFARSVNEGLKTGKLSTTQYQGVITCLPKDGKPKQFIKNWRPISLLNISYKLLSACIASRIQKVLPKIIDQSQKGFMKGRYIGENLRELYDTIAFTNSNDIPGLILAIDFEKAFDSVSWKCIDKALKFFNFPLFICEWFKTLYMEAKSCVFFNGQYSGWFKLGRGCRQGDPLSPYLYLICAELMSLLIRKNPNIKGIKMKDKESLLSLFADDTTLYLDGSENSFREAIHVLDLFAAFSGLKINNDKTQIIWIGNRRRCGVRFMRDRNFIWDPGSFKILGIIFSINLDEMIALNFKDKLNEVTRDIARWRKRNLTPFGKITVIKTLVLSKLTYLFTNLPDPPADFLKELDNLIYTFLWGGKTHRVKKSTMCKSYDKGGIKMCNVQSSIAGFKISWLRRLWNANNDNFLSINLYPELKRLNQFGIDYSKLITKNIKNKFWLDVLKHFCKLGNIPLTLSNDNLILEEPIHHNPNIKRGKKVVYITEWVNNDILKVKDIAELNGNRLEFLDYETFRRKFVNVQNTNFLLYTGIIQAVRTFWQKMQTNNIPKKDKKVMFFHLVLEAVKEGNQKVRDSLDLDNEPPTSTVKWSNLFPDISWKLIFKKCNQTTKDTQLLWFQFRVLHRILPTERYLHICKIKDSPNCKRCGEEETISHLLYNCEFAQRFWVSLGNALRINCHNCARLSFSLELVIFGSKNNFITDKGFDFILLFAKFYVYKCKFLETPPNIRIFLGELRFRLKIERHIAIRNNRGNRFNLDWYPYRDFVYS